MEANFNPLITFHLTPAGGNITISQKTYTDGQQEAFPYSTYQILASFPTGYKFTDWKATGDLLIANKTQNPTNITITGTVTLYADSVSPNQRLTTLTPEATLLTMVVLSVAGTARRKKHPVTKRADNTN